MQLPEKSPVICGAAISCSMPAWYTFPVFTVASVVEMMLLVALCFTNVLCSVSAEWVEIRQTLSQLTTKPSVVFDQTPATAAPRFPNQTMSSFSKRTSAPVAENEEDGDGKFGFVDYIEDIQQKLLKHNHRTFKSKMEILLQLKRNILYNIREKITAFWSPPQKREAREHYEKDDDYHMDFPSNEGALMTIGFLTFAVFLIKLVLKLITALKNHNNGSMSTTTVAPATVLFGRRKRDVHEEEARILRYIDEFKFK